MLLFCRCGNDAVTLEKLQLWRGSTTRPEVAFHSEVMLLAETLQLEFQRSLKKLSQKLKKMGRYSFK